MLSERSFKSKDDTQTTKTNNVNNNNSNIDMNTEVGT